MGGRGASFGGGGSILGAKGAEYNQGIADALERVRQHGIGRGKEMLAHVDAKTGEKLFADVKGRGNSVKPSDEVSKAYQNAPEASIVSVHNHPNGTSFSADDFALMARYKSIESIRVAGQNGEEYYAKVGRNGARPRPETIERDWNEIGKRLGAKYRGAVESGRMSIEQARVKMSHEMNQQLAKQYGWTYEGRL